MISKRAPNLWLQLTAITLSRLVLNSALRLTYPFLPALARGLGVPLTAVARLVALRSSAGLLSPLFSPLSERFGRRVVMVGALLLFSAGAFIVFIWPAYWPLGLTLIVTGVAKVTYDPAMQSYLGDAVPYGQRGRALAITELSWAGALLLSAPVIGLVMSRWGWETPFLWLGILALGAAVFLWRALPPGRVQQTRAASLGAMVQVVREHPVIWAVAAYVSLAMFANEMLLIVYGDWMEGSFGLNLTSLGLATTVIGSAEVVGEIGVGWAVDRIGKRPVVFVAGLLTGLLYFVIPFTGQALATALLSLFFVFLAFEMTVVGGIPLMTEVLPSARSVVLSIMFAAFSFGRMLGALVGPLVWERYGLTGNAFLAAALTWVGVLILGRWIYEGEESPTTKGGMNHGND